MRGMGIELGRHLSVSFLDAAQLMKSLPGRMDVGRLFGCWLYSQVAARTTADPRTKEKVSWRSNRVTEARNEMTMDREVANPLRMLSAYLITNAVNSPPMT